MAYYGGGSTSGIFYECLYNINILGGRGISTYQANSTENTSDWYSAISSSGNINVASSGGTENFLIFKVDLKILFQLLNQMDTELFIHQ